MNILKKIILLELKIIAKAILKKHNPTVIGITGSVGKTSAKEAIYKTVAPNYNTYASEKSLNTEFGLPVTIFRTKMPKDIRNIFAWLKVLYAGLRQLKANDYPEVLVLEMAVDTPGDMRYLLSIVKPNISVLTGISASHLQVFGDVEKILEEKGKIIVEVPDAKAVINIDFGELKGLSNEIKNKKMLYSIHDKEGDVIAEKIENSLEGLKVKITHKGETYRIKTKLFGDHSAYAVLAAFSVGVMMNVEPKEIVKALTDLRPMPGRMSLLDGIRGSIIIDDTYNSSCVAVIKALETVERFKNKKSIVAVLGSMNELGDSSENEHRKVGAEVAKVADILVTIGESAKKWIATEAILRGLEKSKVQSFLDPFSAGEYLERIVAKEDIVLVKGSQNGVFAEEAVKAILDRKYRPEDVLVRQSSEWLKKKEGLKPKQ